MTTVHELHPNVWVDRSVDEVWTRLTQLNEWPSQVRGVQAVEVDSLTTVTVSLRWIGFPSSVRVALLDWAPGSHLRFGVNDDLLTGTVTLTGVDPSTTALAMHAQYRPSGRADRAAARSGVVGRELRGALTGFGEWVRRQPPLPERTVPGGREAPVDPGDVAVPPAVGVPRDLGVTGGAGHAGASPGGGGSMGASSDRVDIGGRVGPTEDAAVPSVPEEHPGERQPGDQQPGGGAGNR